MSWGGKRVWGKQRRDLISSPSPWKSWAVTQGQQERVCKLLHASETATGQTEKPKTSPGGSLSPSYLTAVSVPLQMPLFLPTPWLLYYVLAVLSVCLGGLRKAGGKQEAAKASPLQGLRLPIRDSSCSRSVSVLGSACFPCGVRWADCFFLCSR